MTCLCLPRLQALIGQLAPVATLHVALPATLPGLAASLALAAPAAGAGASLQAALQLALPPLPLPAFAIDQICATATAAIQLALHLGIDLAHPQGPAQLALSLGSLQLLLPRLLPLLAMLRVDLAGALQLSMALSLIATARTTLGIDLLAPGAALALKLALAARLAVAVPALTLPAPPALVLRVAAYARLAEAASAFGGIGRLIPALQLIARLQLPVLGLPVPALAALSLAIGLRAGIASTLGLDVALPGLALRLQAALQPLWALSATAALATGGAPASLPTLGVGFALDAQALASLGLGALAGLRLPDLGPLSLFASVAGAGGLASPACCGAQ
jgi:hypothetical protein